MSASRKGFKLNVNTLCVLQGAVCCEVGVSPAQGLWEERSGGRIGTSLSDNEESRQPDNYLEMCPLTTPVVFYLSRH